MSRRLTEMEQFLLRKLRDYMVAGGSRDRARELVQEVFGGSPPAKAKPSEPATRRMPGHAKRGLADIAAIQPTLAKAQKRSKPH
jgi:hypothetical protein